MLLDPDDTVARTAWRAAVLAPDAERPALAGPSTQLGRGDRSVQQSLSGALATLGIDAAAALERAHGHPDPLVRVHAIATERIIADPDEGFDSAMFEAERIVVL